MKIRQENEDAMQRKIRDLERELDRMKLHGGVSVVPLPMDRLQTPAEQYVVPYRPTVKPFRYINQTKHFLCFSRSKLMMNRRLEFQRPPQFSI